MIRVVAAFVAGAVVLTAIVGVPVLVVRLATRRSPFAQTRGVPREVRTTMVVATVLLAAGLLSMAAPIRAQGPEGSLTCGPAASVVTGGSGPPWRAPRTIPPFSDIEERVVREHLSCMDAAGPWVALGAALLAATSFLTLTSWFRAARTIVTLRDDDPGPVPPPPDAAP